MVLMRCLQHDRERQHGQWFWGVLTATRRAAITRPPVCRRSRTTRPAIAPWQRAVAGTNLTTGSNNIDIGNVGVAAESHTIRLGTVGNEQATFIAGISGETVREV